MNPNKTIPTYQDGEFILWESNAILSYLADKYDDTLLPHNDANSVPGHNGCTGQTAVCSRISKR